MYIRDICKFTCGDLSEEVFSMLKLHGWVGWDEVGLTEGTEESSIADFFELWTYYRINWDKKQRKRESELFWHLLLNLKTFKGQNHLAAMCD